jgi:hypothetical protein
VIHLGRCFYSLSFSLPRHGTTSVGFTAGLVQPTPESVHPETVRFANFQCPVSRHATVAFGSNTNGMDAPTLKRHQRESLLSGSSGRLPRAPLATSNRLKNGAH